MKPGTKKILFAGLGLAAVAAVYTGIKKKNTADNLAWAVDSVRFDDVKLLNISMRIKIKVVNPTGTAVSFDGFQASVSLKGTTLANANVDGAKQPLTIKPGNTFIDTVANVSPVALLTKIPLIINAIKTGGFNDLLVVNGTLYVAGLSIPYRQEVNISFGKKIEGIGKARISLDFDTNEEAEAYFQRNTFKMVKPRQSKGRGGFPPLGVNGFHYN